MRTDKTPNKVWHSLEQEMEADPRYREGVARVTAALNRFTDDLSMDEEQVMGQLRAAGGWSQVIKNTIRDEMPSFRVGGFAYALESRSYAYQFKGAMMARCKDRWHAAAREAQDAK